MESYTNPWGKTMFQGGLLPRVSSVKDVEDFPMTSLNSEMVCLNKDDDTVLYIKRIDSTGKTTVTRYRFYEDPEPTQQEINDQRYVTMDAFNKFKEDILSSLNNRQQKEKGKYVNGPRQSNTDKENVRNSEV